MVVLSESDCPIFSPFSQGTRQRIGQKQEYLFHSIVVYHEIPGLV